MESLLISDTIRKSLEARRRRQGGQEVGSKTDRAGATVDPAPGKAISECAKAIEGAIRASIRESFSVWGANVIPEIGARARETISSIEKKTPCPVPPAPRVAQTGRVEEVKGSSPPPQPVPQKQEVPQPPKVDRPPRIAPAAPIAPAPIVATSPSRQAPSPPPPLPRPIRTEAPRPFPAPRSTAPEPPAAPPPPPAGGGGKGPGRPGGDSWNDLVEAVCELRRNWDRETFEKCFEGVGADSVDAAAGQDQREPEIGSLPEPIPAAPPSPLAGAPEAAAIAATPQQAAIEGPGSPPTEENEEVADKLDELIRLVKASLEDRPSPAPTRLPSEVSSQIAREVAGRLKDTLGGLKPSQQAPAAPQAPRREPEGPPRIPIDDIAAMIDQLNGNNS
jgi:hypothetical protein